ARATSSAASRPAAARSRTTPPNSRSSGPAALPVAELREQRLGRDRAEVLDPERAGEADRLPELLEVRGAPVAAVDVTLEASAVTGRERSVQVFSDELDELAAAQCGLHVGSSRRYSSSAARTFDRARCRSTRWFVSDSPRTLRISSTGQPSTSR